MANSSKVFAAIWQGMGQRSSPCTVETSLSMHAVPLVKGPIASSRKTAMCSMDFLRGRRDALHPRADNKYKHGGIRIKGAIRTSKSSPCKFGKHAVVRLVPKERR